MTSTVPAACAGAVTWISVSEMTVIFVPASPPKVTPVAPVKPVPVIVTTVPPAVGPVVGATLVMVGPLTFTAIRAAHGPSVSPHGLAMASAGAAAPSMPTRIAAIGTPARAAAARQFIIRLIRSIAPSPRGAAP